MKHTKGPWFKDGNFIRQIDDSGLIAELYISPNQNDGRNASLTANAHLISACPEMLEALELALQYMPDGSTEQHQDRERVLRAIAKARGAS